MPHQIGDALPKRGNALSQGISNFLLSRMGWRVELNDLPNVPKFVMVGAPHTSNWDFILTILAIFALGVQISWMAKHTLFRWPFGGLMRWLGGIPVDRRGQGGLVGQTVDKFNNRESLLLAIMPAGTRSKVGQWKSGFYHIAQEADVPIVHVIFDYGRKVLGVGPEFQTTGDVENDISSLQTFYGQIQGRHPHKQ